MTPMRDDPELRGKSAEILDAFTRNVARDGYEGTSFSVIAAELGISRGLIAHHFGTKDRLLATAHASYMRRRVDEAIRIIDELATRPSSSPGCCSRRSCIRHTIGKRPWRSSGRSPGSPTKTKVPRAASCEPSTPGCCAT